MAGPRPNRRRAERIRLSKPFVCRLGTHGVVLIDISNLGARIEHYSSFPRGLERVLRMKFNNEDILMPARVMSCKLERFIPGEKGLTVYRSGLLFLEEQGAEAEKVRKMTSAYLAGTLVEQVANAKGFAPPSRGEMPIFRDGALASNSFKVGSAREDEHLLPFAEATRKVGFLRYSYEGNRWNKKWTLDPSQPERGFTVSANETWEQVESLCDAYRDADEEGRRFLRLLAEASVASETDQPRG